MPPVLFISDYKLEQLSMDERKKHSLINEKRKANRASETEEQRKERLRIRGEKDRARRRSKGKKRSEDHEKQCLVTHSQMIEAM